MLTSITSTTINKGQNTLPPAQHHNHYPKPPLQTKSPQQIKT